VEIICRVYKPRRPRESPLFRLVEQHLGELLRVWPTRFVRQHGPLRPVVELLTTYEVCAWQGVRLAADPTEALALAAGGDDTPVREAWIVPLDGPLGRRLAAFSKEALLVEAAVSPTGRHVATAFFYGKDSKTLRVYDVETGGVRPFDLPEPPPLPGSAPAPPTGYQAGVSSLAFFDEATLYTSGHGGIRRWNLETGAHELVKASGAAASSWMVMSEDRRFAFTATGPLGPKACRPLERLDGATSASTPLPQFEDCLTWLGPMKSSVLAAGSLDGIGRVARDSDRDAHSLPGHAGAVDRTAVSPDLRWIASASEDNTLRLWPMPDLSKPLPHGELLSRLKSFTNLRAVRDPRSSTGWTIEPGPFPGWKNIPSW
jgi:hypothetical protein